MIKNRLLNRLLIHGFCCLMFLFLATSCSSKVGAAIDSESKESPVAQEVVVPKNVNYGKNMAISCPSFCKGGVSRIYEFKGDKTDDESSTCNYKFAIPCFPYSCDKKNYACGTGCTDNSQCSSGAVCDLSTSQCVPATQPQVLAHQDIVRTEFPIANDQFQNIASIPAWEVPRSGKLVANLYFEYNPRKWKGPELILMDLNCKIEYNAGKKGNRP